MQNDHPRFGTLSSLFVRLCAISQDQLRRNIRLQCPSMGYPRGGVVQAAPDGQRIAALQSGAVAATVLAPPGLFAATSLGLKVMADLGDLGVKYPSAVMVARRSYVAQSRATVKKFLMAFIEGLQVYAQKKDFTLDVMQKYARLRDREAMAKSHDYFLKNTTLVPLTDPVAVKNALADRAAGRKLEDFFDNSIVQELIDE